MKELSINRCSNDSEENWAFDLELEKAMEQNDELLKSLIEK